MNQEIMNVEIEVRNFSELMNLGLAERIGPGRSTLYRAPIVR